MSKRRQRRIDARARVNTLEQRTASAQRKAETFRRRADLAESRCADMRSQRGSADFAQGDAFFEQVKAQMVNDLCREIAKKLARNPDVDRYISVTMMRIATYLADNQNEWFIIEPGSQCGGFIRYVLDDQNGSVDIRVTVPSMSISNRFDRMHLNHAR